MPRSPWMASAGWRKCAGVPVLESVAAIFWQMMPDLPMPVRMTRPRQSRRSSTARFNRSSSRSASARTAAASVCRTLRASARSIMSTAGVHHRRRLFDDGVDGDETAEQRLEKVEFERVLRFALCPRGVVVDLEKHAVDDGRHACRRKRLDALGLTGRDAVAAAGKLKAVRDVEHDGNAR